MSRIPQHQLTEVLQLLNVLGSSLISGYVRIGEFCHLTKGPLNGCCANRKRHVLLLNGYKYVPPECLRNNIRASIFPKFSGGACPQTPIVGVCISNAKLWSSPPPPPPNSKSCVNYDQTCNSYCRVATQLARLVSRLDEPSHKRISHVQLSTKVLCCN